MAMSTLYRSTAAVFIGLALILGGCATAPVGERPAEPIEPEVRTASDWLHMAQTAAPADAAVYHVRAAGMLFEQGDTATAARILGNTRYEILPGGPLADYLILRTRIIRLESGAAAAAAWLDDTAQRRLIDAQPPAARIPVYAQLGDVLNEAGEHLAAVDIRLDIAPWISDSAASASNQAAIWQYLLNTTPDQLQAQRLRARRTERLGWIELAMIAVDNRGDISTQRERLARWVHDWPNHPAQRPLPADMQLLKQLSDQRATRIAILLPLQGQLAAAGRAIRDGIFAAHLNTRSDTAATTYLRVYDTEAPADVAQIVQRAVDDGAELIIGPLTRERVRQLASLTRLPVPLLALNYSEQNGPMPDNFYQFGLSTSDDARAAAVRAQGLAYRRPMIVHGGDAQSQRIAKYFQQHWEARDEQVAAVVAFQSDREASEAIKQGLQLPLSEQRARNLGRIVGEQLEFTPRRRQDIDFVYFPANASQARSLKPLLAFHFAQDLPVMASSRIYTGRKDPGRDHDLNGIYFTDTPWTLAASPALSNKVARYVSRGGAASKNLYALGIDAFLVAPRLALLDHTPGARYAGLTGTLTVTDQGIIRRQPSWAVFRRGVASAAE